MTSIITDTTVLESLDFSLELACEHPQHNIWHAPDDPAAMWIRRLDCQNCGDHPRPTIIPLCLSGWVAAGGEGVLLQCGTCWHPDVRDNFWRYLGPINA